MEIEKTRREQVCQRSIPLLLWIALALIPLLFDPYAVDQLRVVKEVACQIIIALMLTCTVIVLLERGERDSREIKHRFVTQGGLRGWLRRATAVIYDAIPRGHGVLRGPMLFLLLAGASSTVFSTNYVLSIRPLVNVTLFVVLYFIIIHHIESRHVEKFLIVILVTGMINGMYCVIQYMGWDPLFVQILTGEKGGRMSSSGFIGNPNTVGGFLASAIPLSLATFYLRRSLWMPAIGFISLIAMGLGIGFNQTLTAAASALFSVFIFFLALFLGSGILKRRIWIGIAVVAVAMGTFISTTQPMRARLTLWKSQWATANWNIIVSNRPFIWLVTLKMIEDRPMLGSGLGTFGYREFPYQAFMLPQLSLDSSLYPVEFPIFKTPHNEYLLVGAEMGILGMAAAGWLLIAIVLFWWRSIREFRRHREAEARGPHSRAPSGSDKEQTQRDYVLMVGFACAVLVSAVESLTHFYFHSPPSALVAVTSLGLWGVIFREGSARSPMDTM